MKKIIEFVKVFAKTFVVWTLAYTVILAAWNSAEFITDKIGKLIEKFKKKEEVKEE